MARYFASRLARCAARTENVTVARGKRESQGQHLGEVWEPDRCREDIFVQKKGRYREMAKNTELLYSLFGVANRIIAKRELIEIHTQGAS